MNEQSPDRTPYETLIERLWRALGRWRIVVATVMVGVGVITWFVGGVDTLKKIGDYLTPIRTAVTVDEINCLNEWVLRLAQTNTQEDAKEIKVAFLKDYVNLGHVNDKNEPIWLNNVHVVRDTRARSQWLVVIDMYGGSSSRQCMVEGKDEMVSLIDHKPSEERRYWNDTLGLLLRPAEPICYDMADFEGVNGKISNETIAVQDQRQMGSCSKKLTKPPGIECWD